MAELCMRVYLFCTVAGLVRLRDCKHTLHLLAGCSHIHIMLFCTSMHMWGWFCIAAGLVWFRDYKHPLYLLAGPADSMLESDW